MQPAVADLAAVGLGPAVIADPGSGKMDDGVDARQRAWSKNPRHRVPEDVAASGRGPYEAHDVVALAA